MPTEKQVNFVKDIARMLNIDLPKEYTKKAYSDFISEHINKFKAAKQRYTNTYWHCAETNMYEYDYETPMGY